MKELTSSKLVVQNAKHTKRTTSNRHFDPQIYLKELSLCELLEGLGIALFWLVESLQWLLGHEWCMLGIEALGWQGHQFSNGLVQIFQWGVDLKWFTFKNKIHYCYNGYMIKMIEKKTHNNNMLLNFEINDKELWLHFFRAEFCYIPVWVNIGLYIRFRIGTTENVDLVNTKKCLQIKCHWSIRRTCIITWETMTKWNRAIIWK